MKVTLKLNGETLTLDVPPMMRLIDVLRDRLDRTATKEGCGEGECGTCTVLVDGDAMNACLIPIGQCEGRSIETAEGLSSAAEPTALDRAMVERGAVQCGFCTPGMVASVRGLLRRVAKPTEAEIREAIAGNICRCTGYKRIVEAVMAGTEPAEERR